ncbi:ABC transporter ATP-binding protein [Fusibacter sp. 3D3]|uniref:ABC transporter ATP-binding protein n=1 Tax=Fusibacter sp. 3D3 TaxID=1048380 RepID=UPI0008551A7F|nr:ABC transporter ATP-binding protein [Fusibacter sp. 3D3]GAU76550.1 ABC transporter ATP-binding protein [Fusibacter sp. 3D3]
MIEPILKLENISKSFKSAGHTQTVLENVALQIREGEIVGIRGKSGSGKSTLLNILSATLMADSGKMIFKGQDLHTVTNKERARYRSSCVGYIPQNLYLLDDRNVFNNIALPLQYMKLDKKHIEKRIHSLSSELGIFALLKKEIHMLSGGEKQRVAICRAIIKKSKLLFADEPTGSLDDENEALVLALFRRMQNQGTTLVVATHDDVVVNMCDTTHKLQMR